MDSEQFDRCTDCDSSLVHSDSRHFYLPRDPSSRRKGDSLMKKSTEWLSIMWKGVMCVINTKGKIRAERQRWKKQPTKIDWGKK